MFIGASSPYHRGKRCPPERGISDGGYFVGFSTLFPFPNPVPVKASSETSHKQSVAIPVGGKVHPQAIRTDPPCTPAYVRGLPAMGKSIFHALPFAGFPD